MLVHGFACGKNDWGAIPKMLASQSKRDCITFDHRGIGESDPIKGPYSVGMLSDDVAEVVSDAGIAGPINLFGISLGGMVAQHFALEHPALVNALVLGCTTHGGRESTPPPKEFGALCLEWAHESSPNDFASAGTFMDFMLPPDLLARPDGQSLKSRFLAKFLETERSQTGLQGQLAAMGKFNATKRLAEIRCPTLVLTGDSDAVVPPVNSDSLAQRIAGARLESWKDAGHFVWATRPQELVTMLSSFLLECDRRDDDEA
jgi:3-oxoadipate enol-lactonase